MAEQAGDILDYFRAQWAMHAAWRERYEPDMSVDPCNALLVRWTESDDLPEPVLAVNAIFLQEADQPPIALPVQMGSVVLQSWEEWCAEALTPESTEDWAAHHFLVLSVRDRALCCVVSPGFPLDENKPELKALVLPPSTWGDRFGQKQAGPSDGRAASGPAKPRFAEMPSIQFPSGMVLPLVWRGVYAVSNGQIDRWTPPEEGRPPTYIDDDGNSVYVHPGDGRALLTVEQGAKAMESVLRLDDDVVSAAVISIGKWTADTGGAIAFSKDGLPALPKTRIHVSDILRFQGIKQHTNGGYRPEQKQKLVRDIRALNEIWISGKQDIYVQQGRRRVHKEVNVRSRFLEVAQEDERDMFGQETPYAFRVAPGEWIAPQLGEHYQMMGLLLRPVMEYDPRQGVGRVAMRLGLYLAWQWRIRASYNNFEQPWQVSTLLDGACIPTPPKADRKARQRLIGYFEEALDDMAGMPTKPSRVRSNGKREKVIAGWQYVNGDYENLRYHGAFEEWLTWTVCITPPEEVLQRYAKIAPAAARAIGAARRRQ
jgi:hypothetical protein